MYYRSPAPIRHKLYIIFMYPVKCPFTIFPTQYIMHVRETSNQMFYLILINAVCESFKDIKLYNIFATKNPPKRDIVFFFNNIKSLYSIYRLGRFQAFSTRNIPNFYDQIKKCKLKKNRSFLNHDPLSVHVYFSCDKYDFSITLA